MAPLGDRQLECFVVVAEERHIGRAAVRLNMTQPPLTRRMSRLEHDIGATLFRRTARGVELTAAGHVLLEHGYHILRLAADAVERTRTAAFDGDSRLIVGYTESSVLDLVSSLLAGITERHPELRLDLEEMGKAEQVAAVREGQIHIGFGGCYTAEPGVSVCELLREPLQIAVPATHHLAARPVIGIDELATEPLVLLPTPARSSFVDELIALFAAAGVTLRAPALSGKLIDSLVRVAATGVCAVVPRSATNVAMRGVSYVPLSGVPALPRDCVFASEGTPEVVRVLLAHQKLPAAAGTPDLDDVAARRYPDLGIPGYLS